MSAPDTERWQRLRDVRGTQHRIAVAALARAAAQADVLARQTLQIGALARETLGEPGPMGGVELSGRMRFGERMRDAATAIDAAHGQALARADRARADTLVSERAAGQAERLHDDAAERQVRAIEARALAELAATRPRPRLATRG